MVWEKDGVHADGRLRPNPDLIRVEHRHAGAHEALVDAALHDLGDLRELHAVVHAQELSVVVAVDGRDRLAHAHVDAHHVREVVLALHVVVRELVDVGGKALAAEAVRAGVALQERGALLRRAVLVLDDGLDLAGIVHKDTAVARDVWRGHGEDRAGVVVFARAVHERADGLRAHERQVAVEHDDGPVKAAERVPHDADRVPGAKALRLLDELHVLLVREIGADLLRAVTDDEHDALDPGLARRVDHPPGEWPVQHLVHHLGVVRLHARSLAGSEDDRGYWHVMPPAFGSSAPAGVCVTRPRCGRAGVRAGVVAGLLHDAPMIARACARVPPARARGREIQDMDERRRAGWSRRRAARVGWAPGRGAS